jgi:hypothetical protein
MKTPSIVAGATAFALAGPALSGDPVQFSHSLAETQIQYGTIAGIESTEPLTTRDNTWWRFFHRVQFGVDEDVRLTSVRFGVEQASCGGGWQPITVTLFEVDVDPSSGEFKMTQIGQVTEFIPNQTMSLVTFPVDAMLSADRDLVVAIAPSDFGALGLEGAVFFIGTNRYGQTGPSMISCPSAGDVAPVPYSLVAEEAASLAIVMTVFGETACEGDCDGSGALDFFDLMCFMGLFSSSDPVADCDRSGELDMFDVVCFQELMAGSCD